MLSHFQVLHDIWKAPGNRPRRLAAVLRAAGWFGRCHLRPGSGPVLLPVFGSRVYPCHTDSVIAKLVMYRSEWYDWDLLQFMKAVLRPGDHYLDVGANTGLHTLLASTVTDRLTCVEPEPRNLQRLRQTLAVNGLEAAVVLAVAADERAGSVTLEGGDVFTRLSDRPAAATVPAVRLDEALGAGARVDFAKIDVEGAEGRVLRGLTGLLERGDLPVIAFECFGHLRAFGEEPADLLEWLRARGYTVAVYDHEARTLDARDPLAAGATDLIAFDREGRRRIKESQLEVLGA
jgi:FkbM family methyltransferase